jgi:hypothetical protein
MWKELVAFDFPQGFTIITRELRKRRVAQDTAHLLESTGFEPGMPTHVWSATEHIQGKPQISRTEMGFAFEPSQYKSKNPVIGDSQKQSYAFSATLARYLLTEQCGDI